MDVTWEELTQRPIDLQGHRVRLHGWFTHDLETDTIWPSARVHDSARAYVSEGGTLGRQEYAGNPQNIIRCSNEDVLVEGQFAIVGETDWSHSATLWQWRVVSAPQQAVMPAPHTATALPASPDVDMVRIVGGELPAGWRDGATMSTHVDTFDMDRNEASAGTFRQTVIERHIGLRSRGVALLAQDPAHDDRPLVNVSWAEAAVLCRMHGKRLPKEEEWWWAAHELSLREPTLEASPEACIDARLPRECSERRVPGERWLVCDRVVGVGQADDRVSPGANDVTPSGILNLAGSVEEWTATPFCMAPLGCATFHRVVRGGHTDTPSVQRRILGEGTADGGNCWRGFRCAR
jgi:formylglycine-generating enzyme required for sulfatase activity